MNKTTMSGESRETKRRRTEKSIALSAVSVASSFFSAAEEEEGLRLPTELASLRRRTEALRKDCVTLAGAFVDELVETRRRAETQADVFDRLPNRAFLKSMGPEVISIAKSVQDASVALRRAAAGTGAAADARELMVHFLDFEMANLGAFAHALRDSVLGRSASTIEEIISESLFFAYKLRFMRALRDLLRARRQTLGKSSLVFGGVFTEKEEEKEGSRLERVNAFLDATMRFSTSASSRAAPERLASLEGILLRTNGAAQEVLTRLFVDFTASRIGEFVVCTRAFAFFLARQRKGEAETSWLEFLADTEVEQATTNLISRNVPPSLRQRVRSAVATAESNALAFKHFRQVLASTSFFGGRLGELADDVYYPRDRVAAFAAAAHGGCNLVSDITRDDTEAGTTQTDLLTHEVPEGIVVYHVSDALVENGVTVGAPSELRRIVQAVHEHTLRQQPQQELSERALVDLFVRIVASVKSVEEASALAYNEIFFRRAGRRKHFLAEIQLPFRNYAAFSVKRFAAGERFPFRRWSTDLEKGLDGTAFFPSLLGGDGYDRSVTNSRELFGLAQKAGVRALVVCDFSCKAFRNPDRQYRMSRPLDFARILRSHLRMGTLVELGGRGEDDEDAGLGNLPLPAREIIHVGGNRLSSTRKQRPWAPQSKNVRRRSRHHRRLV